MYCGLESKFLQLGDVAVLDISATTIEADDSDAKSIPSAESRGLPILDHISSSKNS